MTDASIDAGSVATDEDAQSETPFPVYRLGFQNAQLDPAYWRNYHFTPDTAWTAVEDAMETLGQIAGMPRENPLTLYKVDATDKEIVSMKWSEVLAKITIVGSSFFSTMSDLLTNGFPSYMEKYRADIQGAFDIGGAKGDDLDLVGVLVFVARFEGEDEPRVSKWNPIQFIRR